MNGSSLVNLDKQEIKSTGVKIIEKNISFVSGENIRHNSDETAKVIMELICSDLRFKDKNTDDQYILLNAKLKSENKKENKIKKIIVKIGKRSKTLKPVHKDRTKKISKFSNKYKERIKSIKESDKTRQENITQENNKGKINIEETKEKEEFLKETYKKK